MEFTPDCDSDNVWPRTRGDSFTSFPQNLFSVGMITHPWAKLKRKDDKDRSSPVVDWHPLIAHSADVAACLEMLLRHTILETRTAHLMGQDDLSEQQIQRLCALAALHDAGKVNRGFQNRSQENPPFTDNHVTPIVGLLKGNENPRKLREALPLKEIYNWYDSDWKLTRSWLQTTWSHHGSPVNNPVLKNKRWDDKALRDLRKVGEWAQQWYPLAFEKKVDSFDNPQLQHLFNGALTMADWLGSNASFFPYEPGRTEPNYAISEARCRARDALKRVGLFPNRYADPCLKNILGGHNPYDVQSRLQDLPTSTEGTITILESATGSGKTEAAIGRFVHLLKKGLVDSMYFAVPTRAAAKQLFDRVVRARDAVFGRDYPPVHLAVPGYLKVDRTEGKRESMFDVRWPGDIDRLGWAAEQSKQYTTSPIAVGTVDQVLLSGLRTKYAHARMAGLARSFLVVDEVHASSAYMTELLHKIVHRHWAIGGHTLLMSATLAAHARSRYTGSAKLSLEESKNQDYPLITHVNGNECIEQVHAQAQSGANKKVSVDFEPLADSLEEIIQIAEQAASKGASVLIIRNTVKSCRALFNNISPSYLLTVKGLTVPHHSRYAAEDRELLDNKIESVYGKKGSKRKGVITVATQTVEQSLDIDADLLITDLCPMDVLLQRIGRLHRHDRTDEGGQSLRPEGYQEAGCVVLTPKNRDLTANIRDSGQAYPNPSPGLGSVYKDLRIIEATWRTLEYHSLISIPCDNRVLVEKSMHPEVVQDITNSSNKWLNHLKYIRTNNRSDVMKAKNNSLYFNKQFTAEENKFSGKCLPTRLGEPNIKVDFPTLIKSPFGNQISGVTLSPYFFDSDERPDDGKAVNLQVAEKAFAFSFAGEEFIYTHTGINKKHDDEST